MAPGPPISAAYAVMLGDSNSQSFCGCHATDGPQ